MTDSQLLTDAFRTVASIVREFEARGRVCRGAALKIEYSRRAPLLSEQSLGFRRFGDLLRAASTAGYISVVARHGVDLEVSLPSVAPTATSATAGEPVLQRLPDPSDSVKVNGAVQIRPDIWRAFNSCSVAYSYSRERDFAVVSSRANPNDTSVIAIPSVCEKAKVWMADFVVAHRAELGPELCGVLAAARNRYSFGLALRSSPTVSRKWRAEYLSHVLAEVRDWASRNDLNPRDLVQSFRGVPPSGLSAEREAVAPGPVSTGSPLEAQSVLVGELSQRCTILLDALIANLLQLRGLLGVAQGAGK